jgi:hypothetical protein
MLKVLIPSARSTRWLSQALASIDKIGTSTVLDNRREFAQWLYARLDKDQRRSLMQLASQSPTHVGQQLWPCLKEYLLRYKSSAIEEARRVQQLASMAKPHLWYPLANSMSRKVYYHAGPTNSGKTYAALQVR